MPIDRRAALALWLLATAALLIPIAVAGNDTVVPHDEEAFAELVDRLAAGEEASWLGTFTFERTLPDGRTTRFELSEGQVDDLHVVRDPTSATAESDDVAYTCVITDEDVQCIERAPKDAVGLSVVIRTAVDAGAYTVTVLPGARIAGERADCYRVFAARGYLPALGAETKLCVTPDGIPVAHEVTTVGGTDSRVAIQVTRDPDRRAVAALLAELEAAAEAARDGNESESEG